ncbi:desmoglein-2 [Tachyglossus aculeatus]|uniref:desmoglein-2 n=1 Tax=Tachyglossus aculeatus TaxID=9261 RepID=UPI0018F384F1|nr:desmoglein-2 [Tachyglossus aculeatus]
MAGRGARPGALLLMLICFDVGNGLHFEILKSREDKYWRSNRTHLGRQKREWITAPVTLMEEEDLSDKNPIAKVHTDHVQDKNLKIEYEFTGRGITEPPLGVFAYNKFTGELKVLKKLDREEVALYKLRCVALDENRNHLETPLELRIKVLDKNDNRPVFTNSVFVGAVEELSSSNTLVMKISATDADEPNSKNSRITYMISSQVSGLQNIFKINNETGEIRTNVFNLDRETQSSYTLMVEVTDLPEDKTSHPPIQAEAQIKILDVNDNFPIVEKEMYEGIIEENQVNVTVMRIKVTDRDEMYSSNWWANFTFASGNEGGYFRIETDLNTNEGIITLVKKVDYEELKNIDLSIVVTNRAPFHKSIINSYRPKPIPVKIKVKNVDEGIYFKNPTLVVHASESKEETSLLKVIGKFQVYSKDTGEIALAKYVKGEDREDWITVDSVTSEVRFAKVPDYESRFVKNGIYTVKILAITEGFPRKTATGTVEIHVIDINDNCPRLVDPVKTLCEDAEFVNVTAEDLDGYPNSAPFTFTVIDDPPGITDEWVIGQQESTSVLLQPKHLKVGRSQVQISVKDNQGLNCPDKQLLRLTVCQCVSGGGCLQPYGSQNVRLGSGAIALMIFALLLLLLVPLLLLLCQCGEKAKGFSAISDGPVQMLHLWNSEGAPPEDKSLPAIAPDHGEIFTGTGSGLATKRIDLSTGKGAGMTTVDGRWEEHRTLLSKTFGEAMGTVTSTGAAGATKAFESQGAATVLNEEFLRNYLVDKAAAYAEADQAHVAQDCLLVYSQEASEGSPAGSIGCCSFIEGDLDDLLLDDLGDKFKTLAEICSESTRAAAGVAGASRSPYDDRSASGASSLPWPRSGAETHVEAVGRQAIVERSSSQQVPAAALSPPGRHSGRNITATDTAYSGASLRPPQHVAEAQMEALTRQVITETSSKQAVSAEISYSSSLRPPRPTSETHAPRQVIADVSSSNQGVAFAPSLPRSFPNGNILVTEKSSGSGLQPGALILDSQLPPKLVVAERVLAPGSSSAENNIVVTEMVVNDRGPAGGVLSARDLADSHYVVVRETERVLAPSSALPLPN